MSIEINKLLRDAYLAVEEIMTYLPANTTYQAFSEDKKTQRAVERCLEIVGESIENILWIDSGIKISNQDKILTLCHQIIQQHDGIPAQVVWLICQEYLRTLKSEVESLINA